MSTVDTIVEWVIFGCLVLFAGMTVFGLTITHTHRIETLRRANINTRPMHLAVAMSTIGMLWLVFNALPSFDPPTVVFLGPLALILGGGYLLASMIMRAIEVDKVRDHIKRLNAVRKESAET